MQRSFLLGLKTLINIAMVTPQEVIIISTSHLCVGATSTRLTLAGDARVWST